MKGEARSGELDRRISIQRMGEPPVQSPPLPVRDEAGGLIEYWEDVYADLPAGKRAATGREIFTAAQNAAQIDTVFVTRFYDGINTTMRVMFDGAAYDIHDVQEMGRRQGLLIKAKVKV